VTSDATETGREKPVKYGTWWNTNGLDEAWYAKIYSLRTRAHEFFLNWVSDLIRQGFKIESILEVGCGRGEPYRAIFQGYDYYGTDISEKEISYCREKAGRSADRFFVSDAVRDHLGGPYDLVFSHAVIDHVYDINAFIQALAAASRGWVYISAYRSWHPRLEKHVYAWAEDLTCYNNYTSPLEARGVLEEMRCEPVEIFPIFVGIAADNFPLETVITAKVAGSTLGV